MPLAVAGAVFALAVADGGYGVAARTITAILLWWAIALGTAVAVWPRVRLPIAAWLTGGLLAAFALWTGLSIAWADSAERAFTELDRALLYLGVFLLAVLSAGRGGARRWADGLAGGIVAVAVLALASGFFPDLIEGDELVDAFGGSSIRLSYPLDYWNGLAIFAALGIPLLLRAAVGAGSAAGRGLSLAPVPALVAVVYMSSSRGGAVVAVAGAALFLALAERRVAAAAATLLAGAGSAAGIAVLDARDELVNRSGDADLIASQGRVAALLLAALCAGSGLAWAALTRLAPPRALRPKLWLRAAAVAACLSVVAASVALAEPGERLDRFKRPPEETRSSDYVRTHLLSGGGNGRWQFWDSALDQFESRPLAGRGAGSFEAWWAQHGTLRHFIRDAHSLYLETLGELGLVGLALLAGAFLTGVAAGLRRLARARGAERLTLAGLLACFGAFAIGAGIDWMWELTVVGVVGVACLGLVVGSAAGGSHERRAPIGRLPRAAAVAVALAVVALEGILLLSDTKLGDSERAARRGDLAEAHGDARDARALQPWAASPYLQLALVDESAGRLASARRWIRGALDRDGSDWRLWLVAARIDTRTGRVRRARRELDRARALNPRSKIFETSSREDR